MKAIISVGISASGKTTEFDKPEYRDYIRIERDIMRKSILGFSDFDCVNFWSLWKFTKENESKVTAAVDSEVGLAATYGRDIIISDTNLNKKYRDILIQRLEVLGYEVELRVFHIDVMEAIKRDERRRDTVGHQVIWKQYEQFKAEFGKKQYVANEYSPCVLIDIDCTLAHMNGKRGAFEWDKVGVDDVDEHVKSIVNNIPDTTIVIVLSGRDGVCRPETEDWLERHNINYDKLIMRKAGDMRKDTIVKEEIFWRDIADKYNVQFVIDDRPSVCRMWRDIGLKVFQVGNPHVEF